MFINDSQRCHHCNKYIGFIVWKYCGDRCKAKAKKDRRRGYCNHLKAATAEPEKAGK